MPYKKGQCGNPNGRPRNFVCESQRRSEQDLNEAREGILNVVIEKALEGDPVFVKFCLDRIHPIRKGRPVQIDLPACTNHRNVALALQKIADEMGAGTLTPDEAASMSSVVDMQGRAIDAAQKEQRMARLQASRPLGGNWQIEEDTTTRFPEAAE